MTKFVLVNYNFDPSWVKEYTDDYLIYDRSDDGIDHTKDFPQDKIIKTENRGNVDYDKLSYLVENYDNLPDVFVWGKTNLFKYISKEEFDRVKDCGTFMPLLRQDHVTTKSDGSLRYIKIHGTDRDVSYYLDGMYYEFNNSWYLNDFPHKYRNYSEFAKDFMLPNHDYIPFAPGGNYILTREVVHKYGRDYYDKLRSILPYCQLPGEAHFCERSYYNIWK